MKSGLSVLAWTKKGGSNSPGKQPWPSATRRCTAKRTRNQPGKHDLQPTCETETLKKSPFRHLRGVGTFARFNCSAQLAAHPRPASFGERTYTPQEPKPGRQRGGVVRAGGGAS